MAFCGTGTLDLERTRDPEGRPVALEQKHKVCSVTKRCCIVDEVYRVRAMTYSEGAYGGCDASVRCQGNREALSQTSCQEAVSFGPQAMGTADAESGVDLLVEYEPGCVPGLLGFLWLEEEL